MFQRHRKHSSLGIKVGTRHNLGGSRLCIPEHEGTEIAARDFRHHCNEVLNGHRLTVETIEVGVQPSAKPIAPDQGPQHADEFCAFFVHGHGIKIVDLGIPIRTHGVRKRSSILGKLKRPQALHIVDPLHVLQRAIGRKFLIAKNGQPLLQRKLEPVPTGHPITGPVVEVLMRDDALDGDIVVVGGGFRACQHILGVEQIQALVFHGSHVEIIHRDYHVDIEVVLTAEGVLVVSHRAGERSQCMSAAIPVM